MSILVHTNNSKIFYTVSWCRLASESCNRYKNNRIAVCTHCTNEGIGFLACCNKLQGQHFNVTFPHPPGKFCTLICTMSYHFTLLSVTQSLISLHLLYVATVTRIVRLHNYLYVAHMTVSNPYARSYVVLISMLKLTFTILCKIIYLFGISPGLESSTAKHRLAIHIT